MRILVLGGTRFVGRAIVEAALEAGHEVTMFNRGTHPEVLPEVPRIVGDRDTEDVQQLRDGGWDVVVDVSGYRPAQLRAVLSVLRDVPHYVFISTVSVYAEPVEAGADEDAPLIEVDESIAPDDPRSYGGLKVLCERELERAVGDRLTVIRPTVVIGPHDTTDRFPWWVRHVADGGVMPVPRLDQPIQLIDAGDLAAFTARTIRDRELGTFNAVGPREPLTLRGLVALLEDTFGVSTELQPASGGEAERIPLTLAQDGSEDGVFTLSGARARSAGLRPRPMAESARAVLEAERAGAESR